MTNNKMGEGADVREIEYPTATESAQHQIGADTLARAAINLVLDGKKPNPYIVGRSLGKYAACYDEMIFAYEQDGVEGARQVFVSHADLDADIAALRATDLALHRRNWSVGDLYQTEFPEQRFTIPGILPTGLAALGARPKIGKSWMGLQLSVAVGTGGEFFGQACDQGRVLYLAFEDSPRRMKMRLQKQQAPIHANITFGFAWRSLIGEGTADLIAAIERDHYSLIVIDTLARALGFVDPNKQAEMNLHLGVLQRIAVDRDITILLIDHHRKGNGSGDGDVIDDLIGATSKSGVLDVALGLYRSRGERNAKLKITGRDIEERELALQFERETGKWDCLGDSETIVSSEQEEEILEAVAQLGAPSHREICDVIGQDRSNCFRRIQELIVRGSLVKIEGKPARFTVAKD